MKTLTCSVVVLCLSALSLFAAPQQLPVYKPRSLQILISRQVPGLQGNDYMGDYVQYKATGQDLLKSSDILPCGKEDLQSYLALAKDVTSKGVDNPYAAVLLFAAITKFGTPAEKVAMYLPNSIGDTKFILDLFTKQAVQFREITSIQPLLALEINGIVNIYFVLQVPGSRPLGGSMSMLKKGNTYFPIFSNPESSLNNDVISTFAFEVVSHYLPLYITPSE